MTTFRGFGLLALGLVAALALGCSKEIQIGAIISEKGVADLYGARVRKGIDLALEEINAKGGVNGKTLTIVYRDDQSSPEVGKRVATELIEEVGVNIIIGAVTSSVTLEIAPVCERARTILLSPTASAPPITDAGQYIFRNYPSDILEGTSMAAFARDLGLANVVIFAVNDAFGAGLKEVFIQKYETKFRKVVRLFDFDDTDPESFAAMVQQAAELKPEGIYIIGYVNEVAQFLRLIRDAGIEAVIMGSGSVTREIVQLAGEAAEHLVFPQPPFNAASEEPQVRSFVEAYKARYEGEIPDTWAAHGYDALHLIALAIERSGSAIADAVQAGLIGIDNYEGASGTAGFDTNGDVVQYPRLFIFHQGVPMPYEQFLEQGGSLTITGRS